MLPAVLVVYGLMTAGGYGWLVWRERTVVIASSAIGHYGTPLAVAAGTGMTIVFSVVARLLVRYARPFAELDARLASMIGPLTNRETLFLALVSGAAEEFFFRCAMQDALGWLATAVVFALGHLGGRGLYLWSLQAGIFGLALGGLVEAGFGVLSAALAHALFNYLWLQRLTPR